MNYVNTTTKARVSLSAIAAEYPDKSFPASPTDADLADTGYACLQYQAPPTYDVITHGVREADPAIVDGQWVYQWEVYELDADTVVANAVAAQKQQEAAQKLAGVQFQGVMCSATSSDQNGITAVGSAYQMLGDDFQPTSFQFENGNTLILTTDNMKSFISVWTAFRQSFFSV
ncbi:hypothetical protein [Limnohabitans sp.]|uniref:hypothetical protein n=1 Tax=Limnohabitans sp. TaxID=1907725 RepID=UPI00286F4B51|nr:hypothetical protein [Limnohabitans sp.]